MNMCLLEVAMCKKCRSSHFQGEAKRLRTEVGGKKLLGLEGLLLLGGQYPITCHGFFK